MFQPNSRLVPPESFFRVSSNECSSKSKEAMKEGLLDILLPIYDGLLPMDELANQICSVMNKYQVLLQINIFFKKNKHF